MRRAARDSITTRTDGAVNASFTICAHHRSRVWSTLCFVLSEKRPTASSRGRLSDFPIGGVAMPEIDKVQPEVDLLFAITSTIAVALALGLPMVVAII